MVYWWTKLFLLLNLAASLVTFMIDKFYGLIAYSLDFPWLVLSFPWIFFSFVSPLETKQNQRKSQETKGNQRKSQEIKGNHPAPNQRKPKKIKGHPKKPKDTLLGRMHVPVMLKTSYELSQHFCCWMLLNSLTKNEVGVRCNARSSRKRPARKSHYNWMCIPKWFISPV